MMEPAGEHPHSLKPALEIRASIQAPGGRLPSRQSQRSRPCGMKKKCGLSDGFACLSEDMG